MRSRVLVAIVLENCAAPRTTSLMRCARWERIERKANSEIVASETAEAAAVSLNPRCRWNGMPNRESSSLRIRQRGGP